MSSYFVETPAHKYFVKVERGLLTRIAYYIPDSAGRIFVVTTRDVWNLHGEAVEHALMQRTHSVLFCAGEDKKRLAWVEDMAEQMMREGGDRSSMVLCFGGGIATDMGGFLASIFMRGIPVMHVPTTLLAQVDAAIGGKTGVNLAAGKNLIGTFHQPLSVLIDPEVLRTLPEREYKAGLYEVLKAGILGSPMLYKILRDRSTQVLAQDPEILETLISESVRIKTEVVSADEKESDLRRVLNLGHTFGHALEAETGYERFLHGEAVAFGMLAAVHLALLLNIVSADDAYDIGETLKKYGPIPALDGISPESIVVRLASDKKTIKGKIHFVLPERIGKVRIVSDADEKLVFSAVKAALA